MKTIDTYRPEGTVKIYDIDTKELVYTTHNMIVESGRKLILGAIFGGEALDETKFTKFFEHQKTELTTPDYNYTKLGQKYTEALFLNDDPTEAPDYDADVDVPYIDSVDFTESTSTIRLTTVTYITNTAPTFTQKHLPITAVGLYYTDSDDNNILFSRAAIEPAYLNANRRYKIIYEIQF